MPSDAQEQDERLAFELLGRTDYGRVRPWVRPLLLLYPLAMGLTLMATGEHHDISRPFDLERGAHAVPSDVAEPVRGVLLGMAASSRS